MHTKFLGFLGYVIKIVGTKPLITPRTMIDS